MSDFLYDSWCRNNGVEPLTMMERAMGNGKHVERVFRLAREHMTMGYFRYGSCQVYRDEPIDFSEKIIAATVNFEMDGNVEHYLDVINYAAMAFLYTDHPKRHYTCFDKKRG